VPIELDWSNKALKIGDFTQNQKTNSLRTSEFCVRFYEVLPNDKEFVFLAGRPKRTIAGGSAHVA
jgi:hypothetical protein